jgi:uncharacterized protein with GYD domain
MSRYLFQVTYTSESWATQVRLKGDVMERVEPLVSTCRGTLDTLYYAFGEADVVAIADFPTPEDAASFSIAISAGGACRSVKTIPLLTVEQGMAALSRAAEAATVYHPPTSITLPEARQPSKA